MTNRDLLKEAIADAKAVKETAIANAKAALEESFTPHLKSMLAAKLEEMDKDDEVEEGYKSEDSMDEAMKSDKEDKMEEGIEEEIDLDEILAEIEKEDMDEEISESEEVTEQEEEEAEEEESEDMGGEEEEEIDLEDMSEEDLKSFIEDVISDMVESGELEAGDEFEAEDEMEMGDEEIEIEGEDEIMEEKEDLEEMDAVSKRRKDSPAGDTLAKTSPQKVGQSTVEEGFDTADSAAAGFEEIVKGLKAMAKKGGEIGKKATKALEDLGAAAGYAMRREEEEIDEIEELKKELQEVNLLNSKLLYTNKIFKSKNLSEDKKLKVLKAFDKAETVKEAKVIFETLNAGLVEKAKRPVNEVKGSASKAMGVAPVQKQQPIIENNAFRRMQELAGIIKN